jgi:hypothetical protein
MRKKNASMIATAIAFALALPASALAQDNSGNGPAVVSPLQLPGTAGAPQAQVPQPQSDSGVNWKGVGVGAGTAVGNVLYVPAKLAYGILGSVAGGVGWAVTGGNTQVANTIWRSSLGGDYVLTPNMVAGQEPIHFTGPTTTAPTTTPLAPVSSSSNGNTAMATNSGTMVAPATQPLPSSIGGVPSSNYSGAHHIDSGAGPVGGSSPASGGSSGPLPSTSIE